MKQTNPKFELKKEHILLAKELNFETIVDTGYQDKFAPAINLKRPFGNSGVTYDVMSKLGMLTDDGEYSPEDLDKAETLLVELPVALEIILSNMTFEPGIYEVSPYGAYFNYEIALAHKMLNEPLKAIEEEIKTSPWFASNFASKDFYERIYNLSLTVRDTKKPVKTFISTLSSLKRTGMTNEKIQKMNTWLDIVIGILEKY